MKNMRMSRYCLGIVLSVNKKVMRKEYLKFSVMSIVSTIAFFCVFVLAETYQNELTQLEQDLINSGYEWLVNYEKLNVYKMQTIV